MIKHLLAAAFLVPAAGHAQTAAPAAVTTAAPDPARLAAAKEAIAKLMPQGLYKRMLGTSLNGMIDSMMGTMGDMPIRDLVRMTGISEDEAKTLGPGTMHEVMDIYDPHWNERMKLMTHAMMNEMGDFMGGFEPRVREAMARAYAREFSLTELQEMNRFFATPAGGHYATRSMELFMDPEMMKSMTEMMPEMMKAMPDILAKAQAAIKDLPPARTNKDLTPEERKKIASLLGIDADKLDKDPAE